MATRAPTCRTCAAALARCWVCGDAGRCAACQQCLRCEGLLERTTRATASPPLLSVPSVRLRRAKTSAPRPIPKAQTFRPTQQPPARPRAKRVTPHAPAAFPLASAFWHLRAAVVPALMLLGAYLAFDYFRRSPGLLLALACVVGAYLPYVAVTPVRRKGEFFPLGDEGPGLPIVMAVGGAIVGVVGGIAVGLIGGELVGKWVGIGFALIAFHAVYYVAVAEKAKERK